jgi:histidinol-phosphate aminotransferase
MSALVTKEIEGLRPYSAGKPLEELARERGVSDAIKLASNENARGPSPKAVAAAQAQLSQLHRYPDAAVHQLRHALAKHLAVEPSELVFGNGSNELIELLIRTFTTDEHHIVFGTPSFVVYRSAALAHGVGFTAVPLRDGVFDLEALAAALQSNTRLVFIANPNNPTGTFVSRTALTAFLQRVPRDVIVVLDEAYFEYATARDYPNGLELRALHPRLVVLRTFSKAYGLAALRLGYGVCPSELVAYLDRVRAPFNANGVAQVAALAALQDAEFLRQVIALNTSERERVAGALLAFGLRVLPSQANFLLIEFKQEVHDLNEQLLNRGVIVRPIPELPRALRVTLGTEAENDRFLSTLRELLA